MKEAPSIMAAARHDENGVRNSKEAFFFLLTTISCDESTYAFNVRSWDRTEDVRFGRNIERSAADGYRYIHVRITWDYHLHVSQLATQTNSKSVICVLAYCPSPLLFGAGAEPGIFPYISEINPALAAI